MKMNQRYIPLWIERFDAVPRLLFISYPRLLRAERNDMNPDTSLALFANYIFSITAMGT